jgi:hypothetical protein
MTCQAWPVIKLKEGEKITAANHREGGEKRKSRRRDSRIHAAARERSQPRSRVGFRAESGRSGIQRDIACEPGEYIVVCTADQWAGQKVKVTGTLDPKTNTITVGKVEAFGPNAGSSPKPN